jgi:hypothetical protein
MRRDDKQQVDQMSACDHSGFICPKLIQTCPTDGATRKELLAWRRPVQGRAHVETHLTGGMLFTAVLQVR